jgi:rare lipoprotein A
VVVRVNDRGPFHANRIIDLSYTAALKLGLIGAGSGSVEVERVFAGDLPSTQLAQQDLSSATAAQAVVAASAASGNTGLYVQLGAFATMAGAREFRDKLRQDLTWIAEGIQILVRDGLYKVRLGPYPTRIEASAIADKIRETLDFAPHIAIQ